MEENIKILPNGRRVICSSASSADNSTLVSFSAEKDQRNDIFHTTVVSEADNDKIKQ